MKILQIIQKSQLRGAEMFACQLSEALVKKGHQIDILVLTGEEHQLDDFNLNFIFLKANLKKRFFDISSYKKLSEIVKKGQYDIVQANAGDTLKYAVLSRKIFNWKSPLVFRNANYMSGFIDSKLKYYFNRFLINNVDYIISVSENCRLDLVDLFPKSQKKSETGTIGSFDYEKISGYKKNHDEQIIINIGSFVPEKNHTFLIDIFNELYKKNTKLKLYLIGDGKLKSELINKVQKLGLNDAVKFLGYQKKVIPWLKSADLLLMPSKIEGLPGVILEAMSCEVPVIASNVGGIPEVVLDNYNGFVIDNFKKENYIEKINKILNNPELKKQLGKNGKELFLKKYEMTKIANQFEALYKKVLNEKN